MSPQHLGFSNNDPGLSSMRNNNNGTAIGVRNLAGNMNNSLEITRTGGGFMGHGNLLSNQNAKFESLNI